MKGTIADFFLPESHKDYLLCRGDASISEGEVIQRIKAKLPGAVQLQV